MMTSRSEYRLLLRQDNADLRLTEKGRRIGLINKKRYQAFLKKRTLVEKGLPQTPEVKEQIEIINKYAGYIKRQQMQVERFKRFEHKIIPGGLVFQDLSGLSREAEQKLQYYRPRNIGQASRIAGVSPADIAVLLVHLENIRRRKLHVL